MPFFDDTGIQTEVERGPLWSAFAAFASQLERMVVLNLAWAAQLMPLIIALAFYRLPEPVRAALVIYTLAALPPATAALYGVVALAAADEHISPAVVRDQLRRLWLAGYRNLAPLVGLIGFVVWLAQQADAVLVSAMMQLALLLLLVCANYWGPLTAAAPERSPLAVLAESVRLVWRYPAQALLVSGAAGLALVLGAISVGGLFLAVPVVMALLQTYMWRFINQPRRAV
jgi:hypothetical protein